MACRFEGVACTSEAAVFFAAHLVSELNMAVRGYLTVLITQASSRTKLNEVVWEDSFKEGFVKGTIDVFLQSLQTLPFTWC